jgi:Janus/Ocnus family protein
VTGSSFSTQKKAVIYKKLSACVKAFKFEEAVKLGKQHNMTLTSADMDRIINSLVAQREESRDTISNPHQLDQKIKALLRYRDNGCDPEKIIEKTILPEGYNGKILMVAITGGVINRFVCLRSGDLWHREILKNTENEIRNLGFIKSCVYALGGASVRFESNNDIVIYGTSDDFGSCDKVYASILIKTRFKDRKVMVLD